MTFEKFIAKSTYRLLKFEPHRRKQYRKARYRKMAMRFELYSLLDEINLDGEYATGVKVYVVK